MGVLTNNAISWAAFRLQGGWKNICLTTLLYAAALAVGVMLVWQFATVPLGGAMYFVLMVLLVIQIGMLLIFSTSRVQTGVRRDVASGMIESHRLMPLPPTNAVLGYVLGPTIQPVALALATLIVGLFVAHLAAVQLPRWLIANFLLLELAALAWVVMGTAALHNAQAAFLALFFVLPTVLNSEAVHVLPGAILLLPPVTGKTVFEMRGEFEPLHGVAFLLHAVVALVFIRAAARRYVRSDAPALTPLMGLCLLICWSAASVVAMRYWPDVKPNAFRWRIADVSGATVVFTSVAGMLMAMAPLTAAARVGADGPRRSRWLRVLDPVFIVIAAVAVAILPAAFAPSDIVSLPLTKALAYTAAALATVAASICLLARACYLQGWRAWFPLVLWLLLTCLGPIAFDAAQHALSGEVDDFIPGPVSSQISPMGMLHAVWIRGVVPAALGIAGQGTMVLVAVVMLAASSAMSRWSPADFNAPPPPPSPSGPAHPAELPGAPLIA